MLTLLLALSSVFSPAEAGEIQIATTVPIGILVDGRPVPLDEYTGVAVAADLPAGKHTVETRNAFGKTTAYKEIEVGQFQQARYEYRKKELWHIATYDMQPPPPAPQPAQGGQVVVQETTVLAPGVGVTVTDGQDTVSVGVGPYGGGVTVTEGSETVSVGMGLGMGGVTVTETTTTTTTTTGGPGGVVILQDAPPPVPVEPVATPMASGPFNALVQRMDDASFSDEKHAMLRTAVTNNWISCAQLRRILDTYDFGSDKLEAVQMSRDSVLDPENAFVIDDAFDFSSEKRKAQSYFH